MKKRNVAAVLLCVIGGIALVSLPILLSHSRTEESFKNYRKKYSLDEWKTIETSSFLPLNEVEYPEEEYRKEEVEDRYRTAVDDFALKIYNRLSPQKSNFSFSPLSLYANLDTISLTSSDEVATSEFDSLLGLPFEIRNENFFKMYRTDWYLNENGSMKMHNGVFFTDKYRVNGSVVDKLTARYAEAYQMDFLNETAIENMLSWVDNKMGKTGFIDEKELDIDKKTALMYLTTLYFSNRWHSVFNASMNYTDLFYGAEKNEQVTYMQHTYVGNIYDYGDYISFYDMYSNGAKIKYLIPKSLDDDIDSLIEDVRFLREDEETTPYSKIIDLSVPKFTSEVQCDFTETLKAEGLTRVFDDNYPSLNDAFVDADDVNVYLEYVRQKNRISFDEDGTKIESLTFSMGGMKSTSVIDEETIEIKLNQPFVYIIYDSNDLPIYIGKVDQAN